MQKIATIGSQKAAQSIGVIEKPKRFMAFFRFVSLLVVVRLQHL